MLLDLWVWKTLNVILFGLMLVSSFIAVYSLLQLWPVRRRRWAMPQFNYFVSHRTLPPLWNKVFCIVMEGDSFQEKVHLLNSCGITINPQVYEIIRRGLMAGCCAFLAVALVASNHSVLPNGVSSVYVIIADVIVLLLLLCDRIILGTVKVQRANRIMKEIYAVCNQLLYYSESTMNLHTKLSRCLPYTRSIRKDFHSLLNEWYHDSEAALQHFKFRLGTDEGYSFVETLNSLRLNQHAGYYELMRQRMRDYKEKLELFKESKKETTSYVLFTIAGMPILFTFRLFIYPWVTEGQKLFESLN